MGLDARLLGDRQGLGVVLVDARTVTSLIGIMSMCEWEGAKRVAKEHVTAGAYDESMTDALRVIFWQGYILSAMDVTEAIEGKAEPLHAIAKSRERFEQLLSELRSEVMLMKFSSKLDSYGVSDA